MALPKHKVSKSKRDKRRTHQKLTAPNVVECPDCSAPVLPHHACGKCGNYKGRKVIEVKEVD
jgi:large subunit ribosomal protein L32